MRRGAAGTGVFPAPSSIAAWQRWLCERRCRVHSLHDNQRGLVKTPGSGAGASSFLPGKEQLEEKLLSSVWSRLRGSVFYWELCRDPVLQGSR